MHGINEYKKGSKKLNPTVLYLGLFFGFFLSLFLTHSASAINQQISFQGKLTDAVGSLVTNGTYYLKFSLYDSAAGGTCQYTAAGNCGAVTTTPVTATGGIFSVNLGDTDNSINALPATLFNSDALYLGLTVCSGPNIGCDAEMTPRKRVTASPYAFNADRLSGLATSTQGGDSSYIPATDSSGNLSLSHSLLVATSTTGKFAVGTSTVPAGYKTYLESTTASDKLLVLRANAAQSGNFTEWQDSAGTSLVTINPVGNISTSGTLSIFGNLSRINNVPYTWTGSQGGANTYLRNDGSGSLTWATVVGGSGTNDWGRFGTTYGALALMTSTTYPVWFDGAVYASSSVVFGNNTGGTMTWDNINGRLGIGLANPAYNLDVSSTIAINGTPLIYLPNQTNFTGSLVLGNGGQNLSHSSGVQGFNNTFVGLGAGLNNTTGNYNTVLGKDAFYTNDTGRYNTALGLESLYYNSSGEFNTAIGVDALYQNTTGRFNVAVGQSAGHAKQTGDNNVFLGYEAAVGSGALTLVDNNTIIGYQAGHSATNNWTGNVMLGYQAGYNEAGSNKLYIDNSNTISPLLYGEFDNDYLHVFNNLGVGPTSTIASRGTFYVNALGNVSSSGTLQVYGGSTLLGSLSVTSNTSSLQNIKLSSLTSAPDSSAGNIYFNSADGKFYGFTSAGNAVDLGAISSVVNEWGRFGETYGALALMTSTTYPVWFDGGVYASSTLIVSGNSSFANIIAGTWNGTAITPQYGGTGQNFSASDGLVNFYSGIASTIATSSLGLLTTNVAEGSRLYWTDERFDNRLSTTTTLPNLTTLSGLNIIGGDDKNFYLTSSGNVSASGTLQAFGNTTLLGSLSVTSNTSSLQNIKLSSLTSAPDSSAGNIYFNSADGKFYGYTSAGTAVDLGQSSGGANDWGRFGETYGALSLMTSSTYPVWFDGAVYASSSLITSGNVTLGDASTDIVSVSGKLGINTSTPTELFSMAGGNFLQIASSSPTLKGSLSSPFNAQDIFVSGKYAYVATSLNGLKIVDVSNPASPVLVGTYSASNPYSVVVVGKYAYITVSSQGLKIVDVSNPASPFLVGSYDITGTSYNVQVVGKYAYVANGLIGFKIIDVSNPTAPFLVSSYDTTGSSYSVKVVGNYAYVADYNMGLQIVNISNPSNPLPVGTSNTSGNAYDVSISGKYAYVADDTGGLKIINIANPASPSSVGSLTTIGGYDVSVSGNYAYVVDGAFRVVNIANPASPFLVGSLSTPGLAFKVSIVGKYAYIADEGSGLQIIDINGMETPALYAGNIQTNDLTITENGDVGNSLYIRNALNVGMGGIMTDGILSVNGTSTASFFGSSINASSSLKIIGGSNSYLDIGANGNGIAQLFISASSTSAKPLIIRANANQTSTSYLTEWQDSSGNTLGFFASSTQLLGQELGLSFNLLSVGGGGHMGFLELKGDGTGNNGGLVMTNGANTFNNVELSNSSGVRFLKLGSGTATSTFTANSLRLGQTNASSFQIGDTGRIFLDGTNGNVSASGTLNIYGDSFLASTTWYGPNGNQMASLASSTYTVNLLGFGPSIFTGSDLLTIGSNGHTGDIELKNGGSLFTTDVNGNVDTLVGAGSVMVLRDSASIADDSPATISIYGTPATGGSGWYGALVMGAVSSTEATISDNSWFLTVAEAGPTLLETKLDILFLDQGTNSMINPFSISEGGNVYLTTTTVNGALNIYGSSGGTGGLLISTLDNGAGSNTTTLTSTVTDNPGSTAFAFNSANALASSTDRMLAVFQNGGTNKVAISAGGNVYAKNSFIANSTGYGIGDVAEYVNLTPGETTEAGDVLVVDLGGMNTYKKSEVAYAKNVAGVISDTGKFVMGASGDNRAPLALAGLVRVKVTNESGQINPGDYLVTASKPGYAMKYDATTSGSAGLVGMALEPLIGEEGKITVLINKGLVAGNTNTMTVKADSNGQLVSTGDLDLVGSSIINVSSISSMSGVWHVDNEGNLVAKNITADKVQTKELVVEKDKLAEKSTIGEATIKNNEQQVEILNENIKKNSKIFVTFRGNPGSFWWISNQDDGKFSVSLSAKATQDTILDYWLVNVVDAVTDAPAVPMLIEEDSIFPPAVLQIGNIPSNNSNGDTNNPPVVPEEEVTPVIETPVVTPPATEPTPPVVSESPVSSPTEPPPVDQPVVPPPVTEPPVPTPELTPAT